MPLNGSDRSLTRVAAYAVCARGGDVLLVRASHRTEVPGSWFLPGGGIEFGEDPADAVLRELAEETGLTGLGARLVGVVSDVRERQGGGGVFTVRLVYDVEEVAGELVHELGGSSDEARWVPVAQLAELPTAPYVLRALELSGSK